jgi:hypothetical protein
MGPINMGHRRSCVLKSKTGPKPQDITGQKFTRLTALERKGRDNKTRVSIWKCKCDCGRIHNARISQLRNGDVKSCGCIVGEIEPVAKERLFNIWTSMKQRCNNPNATYYEYYGGKGIAVCDEWKIYKNFRSWAKENGYEESLSIDRIDNIKGYSPKNCRWITMKEQQSNKRNNILIDFKGEIVTLAELSRRTGFSVPMLHRRYKVGDRGERLWREIKK